MVPPLDELCKAHEEEVDEDVEEEDEEGSYHAHLERLVQSLLEEAKDKSKGWVSRPTNETHTELAFKKVCGRAELVKWSLFMHISTPGDAPTHGSSLTLCLCVRWEMVTL